MQKWVFRGEENLPLLVNNKFPSQITVAPLIDDFPRLVPCTQGVSQQQLGRRFGPATVASMLATQFCMMSLALPHLLRDCAQDLANQVRWSRSYQDACRAHKAEEGNFLSVAAAEWFSGLPLQWTSIEGEVCKQTFVKMFPRATSKARFDFFIITEHAISLWPMQEGKMPLISLFSGCGALELGLSELEPH